MVAAVAWWPRTKAKSLSQAKDVTEDYFKCKK